MLQIEHISKTYRTGDLVQRALDDVSLCLRDSEFVAILGPSGSGKTTLLNVIGGLDRYDSGALIINGVSTEQYRDRDWDSYRNHSIGFVFQSYNLIPHQSILANVELALTISGIPRSERRRRAADALARVGLGNQIHKRPSQLSGGQMQRVAIARALVNDPDILLADEPTGALDTETSVQVMDLLREVAKDRLVVMVTHNPELAEQYATRIVRLRDGKITDDSDPFTVASSLPVEHRSLGRASMSFLTAISLSFNNLRTKLGRTLLTAFAGSIGIIGIAMILSLSTGVQNYIQSIEEDTLKEYPLEITDSSINFASMYTQQDSGERSSPEGVVEEWQTVSNLFTRVSKNDLAGLRSYLESDECSIYDYVQTIEYNYNLVPQIYTDRDGEIRQVNPDHSFAALGFTTNDSMGSLFSSFSSTDTFRPMPEDERLYLEQYELKAGHWPQRYDECAVVLTSTGHIADITLYVLGLKDPKELDTLVQSFAAGEDSEIESIPGQYSYDDFLGLEFKLVHSSDYYTYDEDYDVWTDHSEDPAYLRKLMDNAETLRIVGIVQPLGDGVSGSLTTGICYPASLTTHLMEHAAQSPIVQAQLEDSSVNVFTGKAFGEQSDTQELSMESMFTVDEDAMADLFSFDEEALSMDFSGMDFSDMDFSGMDFSDLQIDPSMLNIKLPEISPQELAGLFDGVQLQLTGEQLMQLFRDMLFGYPTYAANRPGGASMDLSEALAEFLSSEAAYQAISDAYSAILAQSGSATVTANQLFEAVNAVLSGYPAYLASIGVDPADATPATLQQYLQSDVAQALLAQSAAALQPDLSNLTPTGAQLTALQSAIYQAFLDYAAQNQLMGPEQLAASFAEYLEAPVTQSILQDALSDILDTSVLESRFGSLLSDYTGNLQSMLSSVMAQVISGMMQQVTGALEQNMSKLSEQLGESLKDAFEIDPKALGEVFSMNMDMNEMRDLMTALLSGADTSYSGNLRKLGYADPESPASIRLYPTDFDSKAAVKRILEEYNDRQRESGNEAGVIIYTDMVDALMRSVTQIIDAISIVLIAFVAISLVVSSIMIGIITYISVLERTKEIGILRAIGASKRNISQVFNAETFLVGLCAGAMGVGVTLLLLIPINIILRNLTGLDNVRAVLPVTGAVVLVFLSMALTIFAGLIPSKKAAKKDPVAALRSE